MPPFRITRLDSKELLEKHSGSIIGLWDRNLENIWPGRFDWLYFGNPAGSAVTYLAEDIASGRPVGATTIFPRKVLLGDRKATIGIAVDFAVEAQYRTFGPVLQLHRAIISDIGKAGYEFVFACPNQAAKGVFLRAGYRPIGELKVLTRLVRVDDQIKKRIRNRFLSLLCCACGNAILRFMDAASFQSVRRPVYVREIGSFDERCDRLWERVRDRRKVELVNDSGYLNWRYVRCKTFAYRILGVFEKKTGDLKGYLVYSVNNSLAKVWDICFEGGQGVLAALMTGFARMMLRQNTQRIIIHYLGDDVFERRVRKLNFFGMDTPLTCMVAVSPEHADAYREVASQQDRWTVFRGNSNL